MIYNYDFLSFRILCVKYVTHNEGFFNVKARPFSSLSFRLSGTSTLNIQNKLLVTKPGDVMFLPAGAPYQVEYSVSEMIVVHFEYCNYFEAENISPINLAAIEHRFQRLLESWEDRHSVNQAKSIIYDILEKVASDVEPSIDHTTFAKCIRYINAHYCDPTLNVEKICHETFTSASSLQRAFKSHFGISPKQYLDKQRMIKALELLIDKDLSIKQIAVECGFTDEKYFSRVFKKNYGYPPSQFRNNSGI